MLMASRPAPASTLPASSEPYSRNGMGRPKPRDRASTPAMPKPPTSRYLRVSLSGYMAATPWLFIPTDPSLGPSPRDRARAEYRHESGPTSVVLVLPGWLFQV